MSNRLGALKRKQQEPEATPPRPGASEQPPAAAASSSEHTAVAVPAPGEGAASATADVAVDAKVAKILETNDEDADPMDKCFELVGEIQKGNRAIQSLTGELRLKGEEHKRSFNSAGGGESLACASIMQEVNKEARKVKLYLDAMKELTRRLTLDEKVMAQNSGTVKIQENQHAHLTRVFTQTMNDYKDVCSDNERQLKEQAVRRIKLQYVDERGKSTITDERAEQLALEVIKEGTCHDKLFQMGQDKLKAVMETRDDLIRMEASLRELGDIFNELSVIVNEQGEILDQILVNVQKTVQHMEKGREELAKAKKYQKKSKKKWCFVIVIIFLVMLLILAPILGFTLPK